MENRDVRKTIRLTKDEEKILIKSATDNKMRLSDYIRFKLFDSDSSIDFLIEYKKELALQKIDTKDIYISHKLTEKINLLNEIIDYFN